MTTQGAGAMPAQGEGVSTFRALENRTGSNRLPERKGSRTSKMGLLPAGIGTPDARKRACPVRGALDGNLLSKGSKALSFDPGAVQCPHCHSEQIIKESREILGETLKLR